MKNEIHLIAPASPSYCENTWGNLINRRLLFSSLALSILSFILFKIFYPYPDFFSDSYSYIFAASKNLDISIWPIGYAKFLALLHFMCHSDTVLVGLQYFLLQFALMHFYFSIIFFYPLPRKLNTLIFLFFFINPLSLYISNTVNSDALFASLSLFWITELIWLIKKPHLYHLVIQAVLLFTCFTVRNNAYYYPLVAALAIIISSSSLRAKLFGLFMSALLLTTFIFYTKNATFKLTGIRQYSLFTGWQLANNALYIYDQIQVDSTLFATSEAKELNRISVRFFQIVKQETYRENLDSYVGNFFIRQPEAPLKQYYYRHYHASNEIMGIIDWAKASKVFESFGKPILENHPLAYLRYFAYPNAWNYFLPPLSHLGLYNYGLNYIDPIAQSWFHYSQPQVHVFSHKFQGTLLTIYQWLFLIINIYYLFQSLILILRSKSLHIKHIDLATLLIIGVFFSLNFGFSLIATINILRYQFAPMLILLPFGLVSDYLLGFANNSPVNQIPNYQARSKSFVQI